MNKQMAVRLFPLSIFFRIKLLAFSQHFQSCVIATCFLMLRKSNGVDKNLVAFLTAHLCFLDTMFQTSS